MTEYNQHIIFHFRDFDLLPDS